MGFSYSPPPSGGAGGGGSGGDVIHNFHTLTAGEVTAKQFSLPELPDVEAEVMVQVRGGGQLQIGTDFTLVGTTFSWGGKIYDGIFEVGDVVELYYIKQP